MQITINKNVYEANAGESILDVARRNHVDIPTLCYIKEINEVGSCRLCVVEVEGMKNLVTSCTTKVRDGMVVTTYNERIHKARKTAIELLLSNHNSKCLSCDKNTKCTLQRLSYELGCDEDRFAGKKIEMKPDHSNGAIVRDASKCILCGKCAAVCSAIQGIEAIGKINRGFDTQIGCAFESPVGESSCIGCGQCVLVCPCGALTQEYNITEAQKLLADKNTKVVAQVAPAVRVAIGEEWDGNLGEFNEGKMITALRLLGFDKVYDVNVGADLTIIEESNELLDRINNGGKLPMFTSCCPAWYNYVEKMRPEFVENLSTCRSPNEMMGSIIKHIEPETKVVSIMPCTAKKREIKKFGKVDVSLTTRELVRMIRGAKIDFANLEEGKFDKPFGEYSGGGLIFGTTGGVMEAALRVAIHKLTGENKVDYTEVRNSTGIKEATVSAGDIKINIAVVHGIKNAQTLLDEIKAGKKNFHFVEVMACPGGCVNGGGQPFVDYDKVCRETVCQSRSKTLYETDKKMSVRYSDKSPVVKYVYDEVLKNDKDLAHKLLHVHKD